MSSSETFDTPDAPFAPAAPPHAADDLSALSPSRPFILRPVATALLMVAIVLAGLVGFKFLPLSALPEVDYPTIQVQTLYPGASPEVMAQTVTAPLERQFGQMSGLGRMSSTSAAGVSIVTLQFSLGISLDVAERGTGRTQRRPAPCRSRSGRYARHGVARAGAQFPANGHCCSQCQRRQRQY